MNERRTEEHSLDQTRISSRFSDKKYHSPQLTEWGNLEDLTAGDFGQNADPGGGGNSTRLATYPTPPPY